uniref:V3 n=1 Tax=Bindweed mottle virus TaxID=3076663 RepID=A0AA96C925_9GEMI|nr:V3 [Bindweed mottle virus]
MQYCADGSIWFIISIHLIILIILIYIDGCTFIYSRRITGYVRQIASAVYHTVVARPEREGEGRAPVRTRQTLLGPLDPIQEGPETEGPLAR